MLVAAGPPRSEYNSKCLEVTRWNGARRSHDEHSGDALLPSNAALEQLLRFWRISDLVREILRGGRPPQLPRVTTRTHRRPAESQILEGVRRN